MYGRSSSAMVRHTSIADEVTETVRMMVIRGELVPEQRVTQEGLARMLGVSTMPVREALLRLAAEGMVKTSANRSFSILGTTESDARSVFWVYGMLEGELAARACAARDERLLTRLGEAMACYRRSTTGKERLDHLWEYFRALHQAAAEPKMSIILRNVVRFLPNLTADVPGWVELADRWQEALLRALESGSTEEARTVSVQHATESGELWIRYGAAQGYFGSATDRSAAGTQTSTAPSGDAEPVVSAHL
jgi:DNA-binding GntR family transcriptional regulator